MKKLDNEFDEALKREQKRHEGRVLGMAGVVFGVCMAFFWLYLGWPLGSAAMISALAAASSFTPVWKI